MKTQETGGAYFIALGGGSNIGAKMLVTVWPKEKMIAVFDCGIGMLPRNGGADSIYLPDLVTFCKLILNHPEYEIVLFLTHAHQDHIGAVPLFKKMFPQMRIFSTEPTLGIMEVMCRDSIKIRKGSQLPEHFTEDDLGKCVESVKIIRSADWLDLGKGFSVRFESAGHIRGAVTVLLKTPYGIFADSGDISFYDTTTVQGASKKLGDKVRWLSIESTNGNVTIPDPESVIQGLIRDTVRVVRSRGNVLIPAFAVGRGPDIAIRLGRELKKIGIPVWSGGLLRKVAEQCSKTHWKSDIRYGCSVHKDHMKKDVFNMNPENIRWVHGQNFDTIAGSSGNVVIVPHGMLEAGYVQDFFANWADEPKNAVYLVGYQAEGTKGRELLGLKPGERMTLTSPMNGHSEEITVNAEIKQFKISGHADGDQLANWVHLMGAHDERSLDKLLLVHGDKSGQDGLRQKVLTLPNCPKEIVEGRNSEIIRL